MPTYRPIKGNKARRYYNVDNPSDTISVAQYQKLHKLGRYKETKEKGYYKSSKPYTVPMYVPPMRPDKPTLYNNALHKYANKESITLQQARHDKKFQSLYKGLHKEINKKNRDISGTSLAVNYMIELGMRQTDWTMPIGESPS